MPKEKAILGVSLCWGVRSLFWKKAPQKTFLQKGFWEFSKIVRSTVVINRRAFYKKGQKMWNSLSFSVGANCVRPRAFRERPYVSSWAESARDSTFAWLGAASQFDSAPLRSEWHGRTQSKPEGRTAKPFGSRREIKTCFTEVSPLVWLLFWWPIREFAPPYEASETEVSLCRGFCATFLKKGSAKNFSCKKF